MWQRFPSVLVTDFDFLAHLHVVYGMNGNTCVNECSISTASFVTRTILCELSWFHTFWKTNCQIDFFYIFHYVSTIIGCLYQHKYFKFSFLFCSQSVPTFSNLFSSSGSSGFSVTFRIVSSFNVFSCYMNDLSFWFQYLPFLPASRNPTL